MKKREREREEKRTQTHEESDSEQVNNSGIREERGKINGIRILPLSPKSIRCYIDDHQSGS